MAQLAEILKQEYETKKFTAGLTSATGKYLREKLDLRNILFSGTGLGSVLGKKLFGKGFSALNKTTPIPRSLKDNVSPSTQSVDSVLLKSMAANLKVMAKSIIVLPYMARDMNITKLNMMKMVKLMGGKSTRNTDMFFKDAKERENIYEAQFRKSARMSPSVIGKDGKPKEKESESIIDDIVAGVLLAKLVEKIIPIALSALASPVAIAALVLLGAALVRKLFDLGEGPSKRQKGLLEMDLKDSKTEKTREKAAKKLETTTDLETGEYFTPEQIADVKSGKKISYRKVNPVTKVPRTVVETPEEALKYLNDLENIDNKPLTKFSINGKNIESGVVAKPSKVYDETLPRGQTISSSQVIDFFVKKGYTPEQAAGIAGNLMRESSLNSGAQAKESDGSLSYGLAQHNKSRLSHLKAFAEDTGRSISDPNLQLEFISLELDGDPSFGKKELKQAKTPEEAANVFAKKYERPKTIESDRLQKAKQAFDEYKKTPKANIPSIPDTTFDDLENNTKPATPKIGIKEAFGSINNPTMTTEPRVASGRIESASSNVEDVKRDSSKVEAPMIVNAPVTNNNMNGGGGGQSRGYDTAKTKVYDSDLINLLQRTA